MVSLEFHELQRTHYGTKWITVPSIGPVRYRVFSEFETGKWTALLEHHSGKVLWEVGDYLGMEDAKQEAHFHYIINIYYPSKLRQS